ncbi:MAG TPA: hypothetical protein VGN01_17760 [Acidobacteriaceae bacterium]
MNDERDGVKAGEPVVVEDGRARKRARAWVVALVTTFATGGILYRMLMLNRPLGHSALMFIGLPAVLAILLALAAPAKTVTGGIVMGITLVLLILAPIMGEGYLCILIATPLFYAVGVGVGLAIDATRKWRAGLKGTTLSCVAVVLLPMCMEGVFPATTFERGQVVQATRVVAAPASSVEAALARTQRVGTVLPKFLAIGFPRPLEAHGSGLAVGDVRVVHFSGAEGDPPGDLVSRVAVRAPGYVRFDTVSDGSKLTQWIQWESSEVTWRAVDAGHTEVTWRIRFERQLDPAWYFTPWERVAVREAAGYLIAANATPETR